MFASPFGKKGFGNVVLWLTRVVALSWKIGLQYAGRQRRFFSKYAILVSSASLQRQVRCN